MNVDWIATPDGKAALTFILLALLVVVLCAIAIRTARRDRARREDAEWVAIEEWEQAIRVPVRPVRGHRTMRDLDRQADRIQADLAADPWPTAVNPRVHERAHMTPAPQPLPERRFATRPIAEIDTYLGDAAWTAEAFRSGGSVADETYNEATRVLRGMSRELPAVVDAPVSPAYVPRHDGTRPAAHPIGYDRAALRVLNEATGSWPIVRRELERAS